MPEPRNRPFAASCTLALLGCLCVAAGIAPDARAADGAPAVHGLADVFSAPGVVLAWGVLRAATETETLVVVRVVADREAFASVSATGIDPFTQGQRQLLPPTPTGAAVDLRVPRAHFADFPRTEISLYGPAGPAPDGAPKLVVYYLGVPDTTPEFASAAALDAYLAGRIARARAATGGRAP